MDLMNRVCKPYLDKFAIVFNDDIFIYSSRNKEYEEHLRQFSELLKNKELYAKFSKCEFWLPKIQEAQVEALKKENVKDENLHAVPMAKHGNRHRHQWQQVLDVFKDEGRIPEAIQFIGTTKNTPLEMRNIAMDFITSLPKTTSCYDTTW
ncbi:hypothetical protein Tco_0262560, partial [Tanacetum coccineum]